MTAGPTAGGGLIDQFSALLLAMSYADEHVRPLLDLEGLKSWLPGRDEGYAPLEQAVDEAGFYDRGGRPIADGYRP
jgi:ABC-type phosphate/phosphonate transport system substrate-binding protein